MNTNESSKYFDLHITGIGYLNRVREVFPKEGSPFWSVYITALHGHVDNVRHCYFDCIVVGEEAKDQVRQLQSAVNAEAKVLVGFQLSDLNPVPFTYRQGKRAGETGVHLKSSLLRFQWIKVDGQPFLMARSAIAKYYSGPELTPQAHFFVR
jgi:hypothetical protein